MKYVTFFTLICVLLTFQFLPAQAPDTLWTRTFGGDSSDWITDIQQTADGGYIITGRTESFGAGSNDVWLIKTDESGDTLWTRTYGGANYDEGSSVQQTTDGGYIVIGTFDFGAGNRDVWLIKTDASGDTLWTRTYGGANYDVGRSVQQTTDGGYIVASNTHFSNSTHFCLFKTDSTGDTLWTKIYDAGYNGGIGCLEHTNDGGYSLVGTLGGPYRAWLIKADSEGDTSWTKIFDGSGWTSGESGQQTNDSGYVALAWDNNGLWLIKTDSSGDSIWTKSFGGYGGDIQQTTDGGYIITGSTESFGAGNMDVWLIKTDVSGDTLWTRTYGGENDEWRSSVQQTTDGGYIVASNTASFGAGGWDGWLIKTAVDPTGYLIPKNKMLPIKYGLSQNYPNPFNPTTTIAFDLPKSSEVTLKIFNILGEEVATLISEGLPTGSYQYEWNASNLASGVYLYRLQAGDYVEAKKMVLMR